VAPFFVFAPLGVAGQAADTLAPPPPPADPLVARVVSAGRGTPRILRLPYARSPIVALRLFVPVDEAAAEGGGGWVLARLASLRIAEAARRLGAEVSVRRTPEGIAYAVAGARADFDYLAYLLRLAASRPEVERVPDARRELADATDGLLETGPGQVELDLRLRTTTGTPIAGTPGSVAALTPGRVLDLWNRTHRADGMTLLVSGRVETPLILASLSALGSTDPSPPLRPSGRPPTEPPPPPLQLLRRYTGRAWTGFARMDPRADVVARLAARSLADARGDFEARVRLWDAGSGPVIAASGVAFPNGFDALDRALSGLLDEVARRAATSAFDGVVAEVRRDWLLELSDPLGRIEAVGEDIDAVGRLDATRRRLDALEALTPADVVQALEGARPTVASVTIR